MDINAISNWLFLNAKRKAIDVLRRRKCVPFVPMVGVNGEDSDYETYDLGDTRTAVDSTFGVQTHMDDQIAERVLIERVLSRMPAKFAACVLLREGCGFSFQEIASMLNTTKRGAVKMSARARASFTGIYEEEDID